MAEDKIYNPFTGEIVPLEKAYIYVNDLDKEDTKILQDIMDNRGDEFFKEKVKEEIDSHNLPKDMSLDRYYLKLLKVIKKILEHEVYILSDVDATQIHGLIQMLIIEEKRRRGISKIRTDVVNKNLLINPKDDEAFEQMETGFWN